MKYGINPQYQILEPYVWRFDSLDNAKKAAEVLCKKYQTEVAVFEILGTFHPKAIWHDQNTGE